MDIASFYSQLSRLHRLYTRGLVMRLDPYTVRPGYLDVLNVLWDEDNLTQKQLNAHLDIEQATLSNTLKRMERDGILTRIPNKKDRRHRHICLTERGSSLKPLVSDAIDDLRSVVNQGLTINDRKYFKRIMKQMSEQLDNDLSDPLFVLLDEVSD